MGECVVPPNQRLTIEREQLGLTVEAVAEQLNMTAVVVVALEAGEYEKLHGKGYVVAYLRRYAQLLKLDAETLIADYQLNQQHVYSQENPLLERNSVKSQHRKHRTLYGLAATIMLFTVLALLTPELVKDDMQKTGLVVDTAVGTTHISHLDALPEDEPTLSFMPEMQLLSQDGQMQEELGELSQLKFRFSADCWVEVVDGDNQPVYSSLQRANEELKISGKPPFRITLGYAPGVELSYNGESVEIDASADTAHFTVGKS